MLEVETSQELDIMILWLCEVVEQAVPLCRCAAVPLCHTLFYVIVSETTLVLALDSGSIWEAYFCLLHQESYTRAIVTARNCAAQLYFLRCTFPYNSSVYEGIEYE